MKILYLLFFIMLMFGCNKKIDNVELCEGGSHVFGEWKITKDPLDFSEGAKKRECSECDFFEVDTIPALISNGSEGIRYSLSDDEKYYLVSGYYGDEKNIIIGSYYKGLPVLVIEENAFYYKSGITSITIKEGIKEIETKAFRELENLTTIYLPESIEFIAKDAFSSLDSLKYNEYENCCYLGSKGNPFLVLMDVNDKTVDEIIVSEFTKYIYKEAFLGCSNLQTIDLLNVRIIDERAFYDCGSLENVIFTDDLVEIGLNAFDGCNLKLNEYENCYYLGTRTNPYKILYKAVNTEITSFTVHDDAKIINHEAFKDCKKLESIIIPNSIEKIYSGVFENCDGLKLLSIPFVGGSREKPDSRGFDYYFGKWSSLNKIYIDELIITDQTKIHPKSFYSFIYIKTIVLPDNLEKIEEYAFYDCMGLTHITIPESVTSIGANAFEDCSSLESIMLPNTITCIEDYTFCDTILSEVVFPKNLKTIGNYAFSGCDNLSEVVFPKDLESIGISAFSGCGNLSEVVFPKNLKTIGNYAFSGCGNLSEIVLPNTLTKINNGTFIGCDGLKTIIIPEGIESIGESAFESCTALTTVKFPMSLKVIEKNAFYECVSIESVTLQEGLETIKTNAFGECDNLIKVIIPSSVMYMEECIFTGSYTNLNIYCRGSSPQIGWHDDWCKRYSVHDYSVHWDYNNMSK